MKIVAEFNSIQEIKDFAELIGQKEITLKADYIKPEMVQEFKEEVAPEKEEPKVEESKEVMQEKEVAPEKEEPKVEEAAPEKEAQGEIKKLTKEDIRGIFSKLIQAGKQQDAKQLTHKYGARKIPEIKEEDYEAIYKEAEELL